jgi:chromosome segregation ATPase
MRAILICLAFLPAAAFAQSDDVTSLRAQLRAAQDQIAADKTQIAQLQAAQNGGSAQDLAAAQQQTAQLQQNFVKLQQAANNTIKAVQTQDKAVNDQLAARNTACVAANQKLAATAEDILHLYETQSFRSVWLKSYEPILGLDKVKLQNIVQSYDDKISAQQVSTPDTGVSTP